MAAWDPQNATPRKQCERWNTAHHFHYLTFSCFRRQAFLGPDRTRQWLADAIGAARIKHDFRVIAYVFMPEHVHLLIRPQQRVYNISRILQGIKLPVSRKARAFILKEAPAFADRMHASADARGSLRFWQAGGGHDRNVFSAEELWEKIHYIHRNPVKRGLVKRATDFVWSSAADYAKARIGPLGVDNRDLPWVG